MSWELVKDKFNPRAFHRNAVHEVKWIAEHVRWDDYAVLDVGCMDSGLLDLLPSLSSGTITGIDIRGQNPMDIRHPSFKPATFSAIIFLSTIEHIGLDCYGNKELSTHGDADALTVAGKLLGPGGRILVTMPWDDVGVGGTRNSVLWERRYNYAAAMELVAFSELDLVEYLEDRRNEIICMELT